VNKLLTALPVLARDATGIAGAGLVAYGAWRIYAPAGFIVAGLLLILVSVQLARAEPPASWRVDP
jgi:hypothetical protein